MVAESGPALYRVIGLRFVFRRNQSNEILEAVHRAIHGSSG